MSDKIFLIVPLKIRTGKSKTDSDKIIWKNPYTLNYGFSELIKKEKKEPEEENFLLYLTLRTTGCWEVPDKFEKAMEAEDKECYIMAKSKSKIIAVYKAEGKIEADKILNDKSKQGELLENYKELAGVQSENTVKDTADNISGMLAAESDKGRWRFKVSKCEELTEDYCKEYDSSSFSHIQGPTCRTEQEFKNQYIDTATSVEYDIIDLILRGTKQIVFTGAPGTGKTYLAKQIAEKLARGITLEKMECHVGENDDYKDQIELVQFHAGYDYSDFMEGLKPVTDNGSVSFEVRDGSFRAFCKKAEKEREKKYIFIIDEINRADLSKVFGELMYGLEYRDEPFATQYSEWREEKDRKFCVPDNVYIIGTMNDIDRSVETFDFALRRRFVWYEIKVNDGYSRSVISNMVKNEKLYTPLADFSSKVNEQLIKLGEGYNINESHKIGPAYFDPSYIYKDEEINEDYIDDIKRDIWDLRIEPIIREYVRGYNDADKFIEDLRKAVFG